MKLRFLSPWILAVFLGCWLIPGHADEQAANGRKEVIYGRKDGMALTMDVFTPKKSANGAAVIWVVSGG